MEHIFLIEDEKKVASFILKGLREFGYTVSVAVDGFSAEEMLNNHTYDVILLDIMLPDVNGIDFCKQIRKDNEDVPILMLTAMDSVDSKVQGLQAGADDYLVKPFHFNELLARIEALLRRAKKSQPDKQAFVFGDLKLDTWSKTAERDGTKIALTAKEYKLLELFMMYPNKTLSREFIAEKVWGIEFDTGTNFIDVYINYLRKKIEKGFKSKLIYTVIGMGYILKEN